MKRFFRPKGREPLGLTRWGFEGFFEDIPTTIPGKCTNNGQGTCQCDRRPNLYHLGQRSNLTGSFNYITIGYMLSRHDIVEGVYLRQTNERYGIPGGPDWCRSSSQHGP